MEQLLTRFDKWLTDESNVAALVCRQYLMPVEGKDATIFPPTYNFEKTGISQRGERQPGVFWSSDDKPYGYNIDELGNGENVCQIDSVGSQANRMEPIFKNKKYSGLVPQVLIEVPLPEGKTQRVHLLEVGHRAADAIVRFSDRAEDLREAFEKFAMGDATGLAKLAPTSIVFGAWDSRETQVKVPRIVRSVIRAYNVRPQHRSAQYIPPLAYTDAGLVPKPEKREDKDIYSTLGLTHAPASWTHGGVRVYGDIRRDLSVNLVALRALGAGEGDPLPVRRYILGLSLVAATAPMSPYLREGCELVEDPDRPPKWQLVYYDGRRDDIAITHDDALEFARVAAKEFGVEEGEKTWKFKAKQLESAIEEEKKKKKKSAD